VLARSKFVVLQVAHFDRAPNLKGVVMTALKPFIEYRRAAHHARCRVKTWHITNDQAEEIADALTYSYTEKLRTLAEIRSGGVTLLGAVLKVKQ
jgi:hypothetical protein